MPNVVKPLERLEATQVTHSDDPLLYLQGKDGVRFRILGLSDLVVSVEKGTWVPRCTAACTDKGVQGVVFLEVETNGERFVLDVDPEGNKINLETSFEFDAWWDDRLHYTAIGYSEAHRAVTFRTHTGLFASTRQACCDLGARYLPEDTMVHIASHRSNLTAGDADYHARHTLTSGLVDPSGRPLLWG